MAQAFILINCNTGKEKEVLDRLRQMACLKEAYLTYGVYDIVALLEAPSMDALRELVTYQVRKLEDVRSTLTMIVVEQTQG